MSDLYGCAIQVMPGERIDSALRRFKKAMERSDILSDARKHKCWIPRHERRRAKSAAARRRRGL